MTNEGAYRGLKVLDLGQGIAAPYCAMILAMHGADVVKLEPPAGDWSRGLGKRYGDQTAMSAHFNRGKRGIAIDLRAPAGRDVALALAKRGDIVIEGFRPGVAARLGLGYEAVRALNPRVIYVSVSGFGQEGPHLGLPCTDSVAQAFSGIAALNIGNDGAPHRVGAMIVDALTGVYAAQAIGVALYARERRGQGARLELSLAQSAAAILGHKLAEHVLEDGKPQVVNVPTGAHRTSDGWVMLALLREADFVRLVTALGATELASDPRFSTFAARYENTAAIFAALGAIFARDTTAHWLKVLREADILSDRINGFDDWLGDPHIVATGGAVAVEPIDMPAFKVPRSPGVSPEADAALSLAPHIGEHGRAILAELGYGDAAMARLVAEQAVVLP
ncbi:MAG TPA: CoA transferase [Stellaceae bacterium]|nr:CoA transferase [Stellaceae bacterium]